MSIGCNKTVWQVSSMRRVIGFALCFVAVGMIVMMFVSELFLGILIALLCLLIGYLLFCGK